MNPLASPWTSVAVEAASAAALRLLELHQSGGRGSETVNAHDDASIQADLETEAAILAVLEGRNVRGVFLSEEYLKDGERPELTPRNGPGLDGGRPVYVVADPLDGSAVYAHNLPLWWYSCVGVYSEAGDPLGACIVDVPRRLLYACDTNRACRAALDDRMAPVRWSTLAPPPERPLAEAWLEIYTLKPKYLALAAGEYASVVNAFSGIIPNGGPGGFTDCAEGMADAYLHYDLPGTEHLSGGLMIAECAGCIVTDADGRRPAFDPAMTERPTLVCATGPTLHRAVMERLNAG